MSDDAELVEELRLAMVSGVGPNTYRALIERFGSARAVFDATLNSLKEVPGVGTKLARRIAAARHECDAEGELARCRELGVDVLLESDARFPKPLRSIPTPPALLFLKGQWQERDALAVAIVGSRHCTHYGVRQAERFAGSLARMGFTVVSGLARGIDTAAHRAAMAAGGRTIAVLASGLANIYPDENRDLAERIAGGAGALISEFPLEFEPLASVFPQRNRLIAGLSLAVLVVEAASRSGALITARHALEQGREVLAVPGPIDSRASRGCHRLIREGARLAESVDDIIDALGPLADGLRPARTEPERTEVRHPCELTLNDKERTVLDGVGDEPVSVDELMHRCQMQPSQVLATLSVLEMRRLVRRLPGNFYVRR